MDSKIKDVKVWANPTKTEWRIYVHTFDNREGCLYLTGNRWHPKGEITGDLTEEEWEEAKKLSIWDGRWHTVYNDPPSTNDQPNSPRAKVFPAEVVEKWSRTKKNQYLRSHGYRWVKLTEEDLDHLGPSAFERMYGRREYVWVLTAPDGREVTVKQALKEIENMGK